MALDPAANFVRGNTDSSVSNTATTISVVDASIFPDPSVQGEYNLVLWAANSFPRPDQDPDVEIVRVTARDTGVDELTVSRGQEGTVAASHPSGSALQLSPTAKMFSDIQTKTKGLSDDGNSLDIDVSSVNRQSGKFDQTTANNTPEGSRVMLAGTLSSANTFEDWIYLGAAANTNLLAFGRIGRADLTQTSFVLRASNEVGTSTLDVISGDASFFQVSGDWIQFQSNDSIYGLEVYLTVIVGALVA